MRAGTRQQRRYIAIHDISLPPTMHQNILAYHALTGCDTVNRMSGHGKTVHGRYLSNMQHYYLDLDTVYFPTLQ